MPRNYAAVMGQVKSLSDKPILYVLNTHQHDDHSGSNAQMLAASVEVIAHRNARINMIALKQPGAPRITFGQGRVEATCSLDRRRPWRHIGDVKHRPEWS